MKTVFRLQRGMRVWAQGFGAGVILAVWGNFQGCPECAQLVHGSEKTKCCRRVPISVGGQDIFDVMLDNGRAHPFHRSMLKREVAG